MRTLPWALLIPVLLSRAASADDPGLTRAGVASLIRRAPEARVHEARVAGARAAIDAAGVVSLENPNVSVSGGVRFNADGSRPFAGSASLAWPVELGGQRSRRVANAVAEHREARAVSDAEQRRLLLGALLAHAEVLRAQRQVAISEARQANAERMLSSARRRREAGSVAQLDVSLATVQLGRESAALAAARGERGATLVRLRTALGIPHQAAITVSGSLVPGEDPPPVESLLRGVEQRVDVRAAAAHVRSAQSRIQRARGEGSSTISVLAQYERDDGANVGMVGIAIPVPLLNSNQQGQVIADGEARVAQAQLALTKSAAAGDVRALYARYDATKASLDVLTPTAAAVAESVALALRSYELGEGDLASVLLVQREALEAERALLEAQHAHATAKLELLVAAGRTPQ